MIQKTVLSNNINLISQQIESARTVAVGFYFSVGSRYEKPGERGISHFCEHLLFKGTKKFSRRDISRAFDRMGGTVNAFTERDDVCVYAVVPSSDENFSLAMDILCSMSSECIFPEDEVEKERSVVENEILAVEDDPDESSLDELAGMVWKDSQLGQTITGTVADVDSITVEKIRDWYEKYFVHGKLTVFVSGNFDFDFAEKALSNLPVHKSSVADFENAFVWNSGISFVESKFGQQQIYVAYPIEKSFTEKSYWAMCIFNAMCGDTMGSRLFEVLREKNGLCYSVYSFYSRYDDNGIWSCSVSCEKNRTEKTLSLVLSEIDSILSDGFLDSEIADAKGHLSGEEIMGETDMEFVMRRLQKFYSLGLPLYTTDQIISSIRAVEKNDIMELARDILKKDSRAVLVYGKKIDKKGLRKILK
ncbi:MAG: insulinase family protein [Treponema sp.]|nr:insulinase family protein [Treponema sp.]